MGTPVYLSPEVIEGKRKVSAASDQYGLGIILYQCVTGRPAFSSSDAVTKIFGDILKGNRTPADELRPDLPEGFQRIIDRATSRDPAARFPSVRAMGKALLEFATPREALTWESTFGEREISGVIPALAVPRRRRFAKWIVAALVALAAVVAPDWWKHFAPVPRTIDAAPPPAANATMHHPPHWIVIPAEARP
jgi:serine/threonine-protein kinase